MTYRVKVMIWADAPYAILCHHDSPIEYWDIPGDSRVRLIYTNRWNPEIPSPTGGQYEPAVARAEIDRAAAGLSAMVGAALPVEVCASMHGLVVDA